MASTYKINKDFIIQKLDNKVVIFDGNKSILHTLNETASYAFKKIKSGLNETAIVEMVAKQYKKDKKTVKKDIKKLIIDLKKKRVLKTVAK